MTHISRVNKTWKVGTTKSMLFKLKVKKMLNLNSKMTEKSLWTFKYFKEIIILKLGLDSKGWICVWSIWKKKKSEKIRKQLITNSEQVFFKPVFLALSLSFNSNFFHFLSLCLTKFSFIWHQHAVAFKKDRNLIRVLTKKCYLERQKWKQNLHNDFYQRWTNKILILGHFQL